MDESEVEILSETESFTIMRTNDDDGVVYHLELGGITLHLMPEEWDELVVLVKAADK